MPKLTVNVYYNQNFPDAMIYGFKPGDKLVLVAQPELDTDDIHIADEELCDDIFRILNGIEDDDKEITALELLNIRSMCVGDVVDIDGRYWGCANNIGWKELDRDEVQEAIKEHD